MLFLMYFCGGICIGNSSWLLVDNVCKLVLPDMILCGSDGNMIGKLYIQIDV